jgi:mono/diheme cytochrome c family protein
MPLTQAIHPAAVAAAPAGSKPAAAVAAAAAPAPPHAVAVDFARDIRPVLERSCVGCHGPQRARSHFRVDSRDALLKGGDSGEASIVPGHSDRSPLVLYVSGPGQEMEMPPPDKRDKFTPLTAREVQLLRTWIDQDAAWPGGATIGGKN